MMPEFRQARHHERLAAQLEAVERGEVKRLAVFMPPRHGKSTLCSHLFPAWYLGRHPERQMIVASYGQDLSLDFGRQVRNLVAGEEYQAAFPGVTLSDDSQSAGRWHTNRKGVFVAAGVGTSITGRGAHCIAEGVGVLTARGTIPIERVLVGDLVLTHRGRWRKVAATMFNGVKRVISISDTNGNQIICTPDHKIYTGRGWVNGSEAKTLRSVYMPTMREGVPVQGTMEGAEVLFPGMLKGIREKAFRVYEAKMLKLWGAHNKGKEEFLLCNVHELARIGNWLKEKAFGYPLQAMWDSIQAHESPHGVLLFGMQEPLPLFAHGGAEPEFERWVIRGEPSTQIQEAHLPASKKKDWPLHELRSCGSPGCSPPKRGENRRQDRQPGCPVQFVSHNVSQIEECGYSRVHDLEVEEDHSFVAGGIVVHNCALIDDPHKNRQEADSPVFRERVWQWYRSTLYTRLMPDGAVILVMTRWHEDDLAGRILREQGDNWTVLEMPALDADENALWPEWYSREQLEGIRSTLGTREWEALYQQRPTMSGGGVLKREWFRIMPRHQFPPSFKTVVQVWDTAFKENSSSDYSCCLTLAAGDDGGFYVLGLLRERMEWPRLLAAARRQYFEHHPRLVLIEEKGSGISLLQALRGETGLPILPVKAEASKLSRTTAVSGLVESGRVHIPDGAEWAPAFLDECAAFPTGAHDDQVDTLTHGLTYLMTSGAMGSRQPAPAPRRIGTLYR